MDTPIKPSFELEFDYEFVEGLLADIECETSAAEVQSILCGLLCGGYKTNSNAWLPLVSDVIHHGEPLSAEATQAMQQLMAWTDNELGQQETLSPLFLPDESFAPIDQLEALIAWSEGFLLGFGLQVGQQKIDNREVNESLMDLAEISNLELSADDTEESRAALFTLIEHIKVAVQLIYWEMVIKHLPAAPKDSTLH
ncbi:UPF0149 family protein [Aliikangiella sp. IMCC44653]